MSDRAGKFFLKQRGKKGIWQICWYEGRQTRTVSCGTSDHETARTQLFEHALRNGKPEQSRDAELSSVLTSYMTEYAYKLASADSTKLAFAKTLEFWPGADVSELDRRSQLKFVEQLRAEGYSDGTIRLFLGRIWAAMNWHQRDNAQLIIPPMVTAADWRPILPDRARVYDPAELGALLSSTVGLADHWWKFLVLAIGTAGREEALRELTWEQVDLRAGIIHLNPEGRAQTKKRRATVKISPTLAAELASWDQTGPRVLGVAQGRAYQFDTLTARCGVTGSPNVIRHTVRTWFAEHDVPQSDADMFMGHATAGSRTGARYTHRNPAYLKTCTAALEGLFAAVRPHLAGRELRVECVADQRVTPQQVADFGGLSAVA